MQISFEQAMQLLELLIIVIGMILLHRSVPSGALKKLLDTLEKTAAQTPTQVDDQAVGAARLLTTLLTGQLPGAAPTATPTPAPAAVAVAVTPAPAPTAEQIGRGLGSTIPDELKNRGVNS
jgi:hypothetical protein